MPPPWWWFPTFGETEKPQNTGDTKAPNNSWLKRVQGKTIEGVQHLFDTPRTVEEHGFDVARLFEKRR